MKKHILVLLWHSSDEVAGGFIRVKEFIKRFKSVDITLIDNEPFLLEDAHVIGYKIPLFVKTTYKIHYLLGRCVEWSYAFFMLLYLGHIELSKKKYDIIYGPTGDNLHIFLSGVLLRIIHPNSRLLLDVLNLEMPEGSAWRYFNSFRKNKYNLFQAFIRTYGLLLLINIEKFFIKISDFVVTVSPYMKKNIGRYYPYEKIDFTPSGVNLPKISINKKKQYDLFFVGRHTKEKGIFDIINVVSLIAKRKPTISLVAGGFCSPDMKLKILKDIHAFEMEDNVRLLGLISEKEKNKYFKKSRVFLHLAYYEPLFPVISILEALSFGLPVVTYDTISLNDYPSLKNHPAIYVAKNGDMKEVVRVVSKLLNLSVKNRERISIEARNLAKQFSWNRIARKELNIINAL